MAPRSVEQAHATLHTALDQAVKWELLGRNPTDAVTVPRPKKREMLTLDMEQAGQFVDQSTDDRFYALRVLFATTGLRMGEATGLRWTDVDLMRGIATVQRALQRQRGVGLVFVEPKSATSRRSV